LTLKNAFVGALASASLVISSLMAVPTPAGAQTTTNCTVALSDHVIDGEEQALLNLINQYRVANGKNTLVPDVDVTRGAAWHSRDMATKNYLSHTDSLGRSPSTRMAQCGAGWTTDFRENAAAGYATAQATFDQWRSDPPHNAALLADGVAVVGVARSYNAASTYKWYWVYDPAPAPVNTFSAGFFPAHWGPNPHITVPSSSPYYRSVALIDNTGDPSLSQHIQVFAQIVNALHNGYNANYPVFLYYQNINLAPGQPCAPGPPQYLVVCKDETLGGIGSPGQAAFTTLLPNPRPANHILNAIVRIRPSIVNPWCSADKFTLVVQQVGTALGLDANLTNRTSAMFPTIPAGRCTTNGWRQAELDRLTLMYSHSTG